MIKHTGKVPDTFHADYGRIVHGAINWEVRLRQAFSGKESGQHTLRVLIRDGEVKDVVHLVEDHI